MRDLLSQSLAWSDDVFDAVPAASLASLASADVVKKL